MALALVIVFQVRVREPYQGKVSQSQRLLVAEPFNEDELHVAAFIGESGK